MDWLIFAGVAVAVVGLGILAQHMGWIDLSNKNSAGRSGSGGGLGAIGDEVFHPAKYESQLEMDRQTILPAPAPIPGDDDFALGEAADYRGNVRIDLTRDDEKRVRPRGKHAAPTPPDQAAGAG